MIPEDPQEVWVCFSGNTELKRLFWLHRDFKHCYLLIRYKLGWLSIDPMANHLEASLHQHINPDIDLPGWHVKQGQYVVRAYIGHRHKRPAPIALFTCVELVKRYLGIHNRFIITPRQLYRHLTLAP